MVFFSRLPREEHKKRELLVVAERFGVVEKYLFLKDEVKARPSRTDRNHRGRRNQTGLFFVQAFVQLGTEEDADMLVKYYSRNPLIVEGHRVHLNICEKYKTLK